MKSLEMNIRQDAANAAIMAVKLSGYLDAQTVHLFDKGMNDSWRAELRKLVLLMEDVIYISSAGIGSLMEWTKRIRSQQGDIVLVRPSEKVMKVLEMLGFTRILKVVNSEEEALTNKLADAS
ncbi:MAG: STAS domain-containing protein [Candidatus Sumerlaeota bacterium]|nr:STAS domain-containing protein [Candidatus Sumerlaeota bacterium]